MATFDLSKIPKFILIHGIFEHARKSKQFIMNIAISDIKMRRDAKHIPSTENFINSVYDLYINIHFSLLKYI